MLRRLLAALLCSATLAFASEEPARIAADAVWRGETVLKVPTVVAAGVTLSLAPGATVRIEEAGSLRIEGALFATGTPEAPVRLTGSRESESPLLEIADDPAVARLHGVEVRGAKNGVVAHGGLVVISASRFTGNGAALALDAKAHGQVTDTAFEENDLGLSLANGASASARRLDFRKNGVGAALQNSGSLHLGGVTFRENGRGYVQRYPGDARIEDATFADNEVGVDLYQTQKGPVIATSRFTANRTAFAAGFHAHPLLEASEFTGNRIAADISQFSGPFLRHNSFRDNEEALRLDKRCSARVEGNRFEGNRVALFADSSSYPRVAGNGFFGNEWHVRLGDQQSADWEQRQGSRAIAQERAQEAGSKNPMFLGVGGGVPSGEGVFSVANNAWDEATLAEMTAGPETNLTRFWDGHDRPPVTYEGFGSETYAVDRIRWAEPLEGPLPPLGPEGWLPLSDQRPADRPPPVERPGGPAPGLPGPAPVAPGR